MLGVVRRNPAFRRLWLSQVVSEAGDWLNRIAILTLIGSLGGIELGLGLLFGVELATRLLPTALLGPLAGPVADRMPRRLLMVLADVIRAALVLGLLLVGEPDDLPLLYVLLAGQMAVGIFFQAARSASIPNTVGKDELHEAYSLAAVTWSAMLSVGALSGALLVRWIGTDGVFVLDAATYLTSALLLVGLRLSAPPSHPEPFRVRDVLLLTDMRRALEHVRSLGLSSAIFAKSFWGGAGGYLVLLSLAGNERFSDAPATAADALATGAAATAVGLLYFARGVGTGIGPVLARRFHGSADPALRRQIAAGFLVGAFGYVLFSFCRELAPALLCVALAHMGGSTLWVASTVLWQKQVADAFRGRVFTLEFLGMTLAFSAGGFLAGWIYDATASLDLTIWATSAVVLVAGAGWLALARHGAVLPDPAA